MITAGTLYFRRLAMPKTLVVVFVLVVLVLPLLAILTGASVNLLFWSSLDHAVAPGLHAWLILLWLGVPALLWYRFWWLPLTWITLFVLSYRTIQIPFYHWYAAPAVVGMVILAACGIDAVLTLDNVTVSGTTINDNAGIELYDTVKLSGGASIQGAPSAALGAITNNGTLEVAGLVTLLNDTLTNTDAVIQVDDGTTLTLSGVHITGGTINDGTADGAGGNINVTADVR